MWFELINTVIAAAGLGLASMSLFKKGAQVESYEAELTAVCFQRVTEGLRREKSDYYADNGETK
ncbi:hypothetical protein [Tateyamaria sp.]|uniref:hypothetical protein n=1 Tax=Tateyamaria sp. TaxID=1929288 RepID=UPI00329BECA4